MAAIVINVAGNYDDKALKQAQTALGKLGGTAKKQSSVMDSAFSGLGKKLVAGLSIAGVTAVMGKATKAAAESEIVSARTANAIQTTGAAAWTSAKQISDLATALSNKTGIDDEAIQSSQNMLLMFTNVKNAGEGQAAVFDRASAAAVDLSKAMGMDMGAASKALGKALNDPVAGLGGLTKAGVQFTAEQKAQIAAMAKRGDLLGAQQVILGEVEKRAGGAAAAMANPMERLQTMTENLLEALGGGLMTALNSVVTSLGPVFQQLTPILTTLGAGIGQALAQVAQAVQPLLGPMTQVIGTLVQVFTGTLAQLLPPIAEALAGVATALAPLIAKAGKFVGILIEALLPVLTPILNALTPVIDALVTGLSPILDILIQLVQMLAPYLGLIGQTFGQLLQAIAPLLPLIGLLLQTALTPTMAILKLLIPIITNVASAFAGFATGFISQVVNVIVGALGGLARGIGSFFSNILGHLPFVGDTFREAGDAIQSFASQLGNTSNAATSAVAATADASKTAATTGQVLGRTLGDGINKGVGDSTKTIKANVEEQLKKVGDAAKTALDKFKDKAKAFFDFKDEVAASIRDTAKMSTDTGSIVGPSSGSIISNLQAKLSQIRNFGDQLKQLRKLGLGDYALQQIIEAGPDAGSQLAAALIAGGKAAIGQVNSLNTQIARASAGVGTTAAESRFGTTAAAMRGVQQTNITMKDGAVQIKFDAAVTAADKAAISQAVKEAVRATVQEINREAARK